MAEKYCEDMIRLIDLRIKIKELPDDAPVEAFLATAYFSMGQIDKAEQLYKRATRNWTKNVSTTDALWRSSFLFKLDSSKGNFFSAIKHRQTAQSISDSIFTITKNKQLEELKMVYETDQKDYDIKLLTQKELSQKTELKQQAIVRNISFAVGALLIIIVALLYNRYRLKQKTNRKLELQQLEITEQNFSLQHLLKEKEWLVKEIHHRVKNNLQTVMGLLGTQSGYLKNEEAISAINDSQHRIQSMSLIHTRLYRSNNLSAIKMSDYVHELVDSLRDSFNTHNNVRFQVNVDPVELDLAHCIPIGLILNEAITNSFKYAFPNNRPGVICIELRTISENNYLLSIKDDGVGLPAGFNADISDSMGMNLMKGLSEEIGTQFILSTENGTRIDIIFTYDPGLTTETMQTKTETVYQS
jgi:two-component sensor histidine kinase